MQILDWNNLQLSEQEAALRRPVAGDTAVRNQVADILEQVRLGGDEAVLNFSRLFDTAPANKLQVNRSEMETAWNRLGSAEQDAMRRAVTNIRKFHTAQAPGRIRVEVEPGLVCERLALPIDSVGIYAPGGNAPLFSSLLMAAVPARLAGVRRIAVASPPSATGNIHPTVLAAGYLCQVDEVYCVGGAQAIAAMGFGTNSIDPVNKIVGPGNKWVNEAKAQICQWPGGPSIDLPAGPSEVMVLADSFANADWVAADLLSQAEHDPVAQVILLSDSAQTIKSVERAVLQQLQALPRKAIAEESLKNARLIQVGNQRQMLELVNRYAPEHLIIQVRSPRKLLGGIRNAGSVFLGPYTPEALGDYASGTNHVLPTAGAARSYSGLGVQSFIKFITVQEASKTALRSLGPVVQKLAQMETLAAHSRAVAIRLGQSNE